MSDPNADTRIFDFFGIEATARTMAEHCENIGCDLHEFTVNTESGEWVVIVKRRLPCQKCGGKGTRHEKLFGETVEKECLYCKGTGK